MKKVRSFDELKALVGEETLSELLQAYSSLKEDYRDERVELLLGGKFQAESEMEIYQINQRPMLILKPKNERAIFIPL